MAEFKARLLLKLPTSEAFRAQFRQTPALLGQRLRVEGERIMAKSKDVYVPVDLGVLKKSGRVSGPETSGTTRIVTLSYGDAATPYALAVHEIPPGSGGRWGVGARHRPPTQYKYLERAVLEALPGLAERLAR